MKISNREISQNGLILSLQEEIGGLKGNVAFWKERTSSKLLLIEEMDIRICDLEKENDELRISLSNIASCDDDR